MAANDSLGRIKVPGLTLTIAKWNNKKITRSKLKKNYENVNLKKKKPSAEHQWPMLYSLQLFAAIQKSRETVPECKKYKFGKFGSGSRQIYFSSSDIFKVFVTALSSDMRTRFPCSCRLRRYTVQCTGTGTVQCTLYNVHAVKDYSDMLENPKMSAYRYQVII